MKHYHFKTNGNGCFHIVFKNGITLSTFIGAGSYTENHNVDYPTNAEASRIFLANESEIGIWNDTGEWITESIVKEAAGIDTGGDSVCGHVSFDDWLKIFDYCRNL